MKHDDTTLQAAIDAAMHEIRKNNSCKGLAACKKSWPKSWRKESPARLALAKAFLAKLDHFGESKPTTSTFEAHGKTWTHHDPDAPMPCDGEAIIEIIDTQGNIAQSDGIRLLPRRARSNAWKHTKGWRYADEPDSTDWKAKYEQAEAELAALKSSPIGILRPLSEVGPVPDGCVRVKGHKCTENDWCLAHWENRRNTHFADIRLPSTETPVLANQAADPYARLKAYAKAGARIRLNKGTWRINNFWAWTDFVENYEVHPDDLRMVPEYAPVNEPPMQQVPLGPEDVMPGSVIRGRNWALDWGKCWLAVLETTPTGVHCNRGDEYRFTSLQYDWQINRSIPLTGKWDANAWEPCYKMI